MCGRLLPVMGLALLAWSGPARGQTAPDPLTRPHGILVCRVTPMGRLQVLEEFDSPDSMMRSQRQIKVAVDSAGAPVFLQVWMPRREAGGRTRAQVLLAGFIPGAKAFRAEGDADSMLTETDSTRFPKLQAMSDSEVAVARALAVWIWDRRCMRNRTSPQMR